MLHRHTDHPQVQNFVHCLVVMAAPTRPAVVLDDDTRTAAYQSLDNVDEALYNSFRFVYERAVFQRFVAMRLASIADQRR